MIERRCLERRFLLQPSPVVNQTFDYMLAISSERFSMGLIGDVARDSLRRLAVLTRIATFRRDYREALAAFAAGVRDVVFPMGTYQMVERYAVACRPPP